jgi:hypothetical protein
VLDTNVLLLLLVGAAARHRLKTFKRTATWEYEDYITLLKMINGAQIILLQPILVETSDLLKGHLEGCAEHLKLIIDERVEHQYSSRTLAASPSYIEYGLADSSLFEMARSGITIVSNDGPLCGYLVGLGYKAINFTQVIYPNSY